MPKKNRKVRARIKEKSNAPGLSQVQEINAEKISSPTQEQPLQAVKSMPVKPSAAGVAGQYPHSLSDLKRSLLLASVMLVLLFILSFVFR
jgi:hypothetical protein